jgi:hypothetical protein
VFSVVFQRRACHPCWRTVSKGCSRFEYRLCRVRASGTFVRKCSPPRGDLGDRLGRRVIRATSVRACGAFDGWPIEAEALVQDNRNDAAALRRFFAAPAMSADDRRRNASSSFNGSRSCPKRISRSGRIAALAKARAFRAGPQARHGVASEPPSTTDQARRPLRRPSLAAASASAVKRQFNGQ